MVLIPGGTFRMGSDAAYAYPADGEGPVHEVDARPTSGSAVTTVTNARFAASSPPPAT